MLLLLFGNYRFYKTLVGSMFLQPCHSCFSSLLYLMQSVNFRFFLDADIPRRKESRTVSRVRQTTGCPGKEVSL